MNNVSNGISTIQEIPLAMTTLLEDNGKNGFSNCGRPSFFLDSARDSNNQGSFQHGSLIGQTNYNRVDQS